ncbi:MAG: HD-GYP domain-containing protein [Magnetococcales bacterium]|nr:HD-GYP domain-containing protein [Magnetococcales bacterium]
MKKRIAVDHLESGMYVESLAVDWSDPLIRDRDTGAIQEQCVLSSQHEVDAIIAFGVTEVIIDTDKGKDVTVSPTAGVAESLAAQLEELGVPQIAGNSSAARNERSPLIRAATIKDHAREVIGESLEAARLGKPTQLTPVRDSVKQITDSLFEDPDALLSFSMLKRRDDYTFMHSLNVGVLMVAFCQAEGVSEDKLIDAGVGGMLHDIGKMRLPQSLLTVQGRLSEEQTAKIRQHVVLGRRHLERSPGISETTLQIVSEHHERLDGSGYPNGLKGDAISPLGQMTAIVDVYDAITSDTTYHQAQAPNQALQRMMALSKQELNGTLFQRFVRTVGIYPLGSLVQLENGLIGVVIAANRESLLHPVITVVKDSTTRKNVEPRRIDLMEYKGKEEGRYEIQGQVSSRKWGIDPRQYMPMPALFA